MLVGGLGLCETMHVKLIVEPVSMNISGIPIIVVIGSELFVEIKFETECKRGDNFH